MKQYEHSSSFDKLKRTKEAISGNLTSAQYLQTLDFFIWHALTPIATECPSFFLNYLAKVVARQSLKASAKYSSDDRAKLPLQLFNTLTTYDPKKMIASSRKLYFNRGMLLGFITLFHRRLRYYLKLCSGAGMPFSDLERRMRMLDIERTIGMRSGGHLYGALMESAHWDDKAREFKAAIVEKYTRMALNHAKGAYADYNHEVALDDITSVYMVVVNRAIDRCDSRLGVLTVFITNWFKSARSAVHELAKEQRHQSYEALTEELGDAIHEAIGVTMPDLDYELQQEIAYAAKQVDAQGLVRIALGINEFVTRPQQKILEMLAVDLTDYEFTLT